MPTMQQKASSPGTYWVQVPLAAMSHGAGVGIITTFTSGSSGSYTILLSGDPHNSPNGPVNTIGHDVLGMTQTTGSTGNIAFPCTWIGLSVASISGTIVMSIITTPVPGAAS